MPRAGRPPDPGEAIDTATRHMFELGVPRSLCEQCFSASPTIEHVLVAVMHHIAADGWSITPLVRDLGVAYASRCAGRAPGWANFGRCSMPITRCGSARSWVTSTTAGSRIAAQLAYWQVGPGTGCLTPGSCPQIGPTHPSPITAAPGLRWTGRRGCSSRSLGSTRAQREQFHGDAGRAGGCCWPSSAPAPRWPSGSRSPGAATPRWMSWSAFSLIPWCCGIEVGGDLTVAELLAPGATDAAWPPTAAARMCPLRCWWSISIRLGRDPSPVDSGDAGLAERSQDAPARPLAGRPWVICRSPRCRWTPTPPAWTWRFSLAERYADAGDAAGIGGTVEFRTDVFDPAASRRWSCGWGRWLVAMTAHPRQRLF